MATTIKNKRGRPKLSERAESDTDVCIGNLLRRRRIEVGMTQTDLAAQAGLLRQQVDRYERHGSPVSAARLRALAEALEVSVLYFFPDHHQPLPVRAGIHLGRLADECATLPPDTLRHMLALVRSFKAHGVAA